MSTPTTLTLVHYERDVRGSHGEAGPLRFGSRSAADMAPERPYYKGYTFGEVRPVAREYYVGKPVKVHAFGRLRDGHVTKLGRSRITVEYKRNREGELAERAFAATEIYD